jgi:hypothetical protein
VPNDRRACRPALAALSLAALAASAAGAQVTQPAGTREYGIDAGLVVALGDQSSVQIDVPAARARVGFFRPASRWSIEPAIGLSYLKVEEADGALFYNLEGGALYHFAPPENIDAAQRASVAYARPFVNLTGVTGDDGDSEFSIGSGLGVKVPMFAPQVALRLEANLGYGFSNEAFRLGAFAGLSFFR